ncbi:MAG: ATP synthase F1 subunit gamma [Lachnospiraceae bacterium]|nr:ATP synthase F1 subunit gamma [Lachnospiraceae bacterium]
MATLNEIKNRISGVRSTKKITNAMYLISSVKMRKARADLENVRPFFEAQAKEIKRIFRNAPSVDSGYFSGSNKYKRKKKAKAYLVITADKGMAGAYNMNVLRTLEKERQKEPGIKIFAIGENGIRYFRNHRIPVAKEFHEIAPTPSYKWARMICAGLLTTYLDGEVNEIRMIYSDVESELSCVVRNERLLPFSEEEFIDEEDVGRRKKYYNFDPSPEGVLESFMPQYVSGNIYGALVDSFCAEQNSRMAAMRSANDNAEELLYELRIEYNRIRQGMITQEITEVAAGARSQKRKRKKKKNMNEDINSDTGGQTA